MNAAKENQPGRMTRLKASLRSIRGSKRWKLVLACLLVLGPIVGFVLAWNRWGGQVVAEPAYQLSPENIDLTAQPPWIRSDVKADIIATGAVSNLSILDERVTIKIADAFSIHPWIGKVIRVSKHFPARVAVEVVYRQPVAMVEVMMHDQPGLLPVDADGNLLPPDDFQQEHARDYLRIAAPNTSPAGGLGEPWGDPRVAGAARIAALLESCWQKIGVYRIVAYHKIDRHGPPVEPTFELFARNGSRIIWGKAPSPQSSLQLDKAVRKTRALLSYVEKSGSLDTLNEPVDIDLRDGIEIATRTASRQLIPPSDSTQ